MENVDGRQDRITYSESRTINIGNFEKVETFLCYSGNLKFINFVDKSVTVQHSESVSFDDDETNFNENAKRVVAKVKRVLGAREKQIRKMSEDFVDFQTQDKTGY